MERIFREVKKNLILITTKELNFPVHVHEDIELIYVKKGSGTACCDGRTYKLEENSFFLVFPNQVHFYEDCSTGEYLLLIVKPTDLLGLNEVFSEGIPLSPTFHAENNEIIKVLETAKEELAKEGRSIIADAYLTIFFAKLLKNIEIGKNEVSNNTVLKILDYCSAHYKDNISLTDVARKLNLSRSSVSHIFSLKLNMNFCDYINSLRLNDAVNLMKHKEYSITEISYLSGFTTIRTFNRAFLKRYSLTPSEYRKTMS